MLAIEKNRENHPILNQMYDILIELHIQGKHYVKSLYTWELKEMKKQKGQKNKQYIYKITLYRLLPDLQEG